MTVEYKSREELDAYAATDSTFIDYTHFEDDATRRKSAQADFINGRTYTPNYQYPKLDALHDEPEGKGTLAERKSRIYEAVLELEANKTSGAMPQALCELYASFHEMRLKRILLVEAAQRIRTVSSSSEQEIARQEYADLNRELFGEINKEWFDNMMANEADRVARFTPSNDAARSIHAELSRYFDQHHFEKSEESDIDLDLEEKRILKDVLYERFGNSLAEIPNTPDDVYYEAQECADILQRCLDAEGLGALGWRCIVDPKKSNPATSAEKRLISLPSSTRRNASELRRLWLHEGGIHAVRGENGRATGIKPLASGTANYADVEEGAGVLFECIESGDIEGSPAFVRARDRYILSGLAQGTDGVTKDGRQAYEIMWRLLALRDAKDGVIDDEIIAKARNPAMAHDDNAYRSTNFAMPGVIYSKLQVYFDGLVKNIVYVKKNRHRLKEAVDDMLIGKDDHTDDEEMSRIKELLPTS